jgi:LexA-binding, inner membrane-associated putative hydrolase
VFVLGHLGIGSWLAARRVRAEQIAWLLFGAVLPDLIDKPLYYALVVATGRRGADLGLVSGTRTFAHTLLFAVLLWLVVPRRIGTPLFLGIATHLFLDEMGDVARWFFPALGTHPPPGTISAILFPLLGPHFPVSPFRTALEHVESLDSAWVIAGEVIGAALLAWQWRRGVFDALRQRRPVEKSVRGNMPGSG